MFKIGTKTTTPNNMKIIKLPVIEINDAPLRDAINSWLKVSSAYKQIHIAELMKELGYNESDKLSLTNYDKKDNSFDCILEKDGGKKRITMMDGDPIDVLPSIHISDDVSFKTYACYPGGDKWAKLTSYGIYKCETGNTYERFFSDFLPGYNSFEVSNKNNILYFSLSSSSNKESDSYRNLELINEEVLEKKLQNFSFLENVEDLYKEILDITAINPADHKELFLAIRETNDYDTLTTGLISLRYGEIKEFITKRDGITVFIDEKRQWKCTKENVSIVRDYRGKYKIFIKLRDEQISIIDTTHVNTRNVIDQIEKVIEKTKTL